MRGHFQSGCPVGRQAWPAGELEPGGCRRGRLSGQPPGRQAADGGGEGAARLGDGGGEGAARLGDGGGEGAARLGRRAPAVGSVGAAGRVARRAAGVLPVPGLSGGALSQAAPLSAVRGRPVSAGRALLARTLAGH